MNKSRFDFEQEIMDCWKVVDDIDTLYEYFGDSPDFVDMPAKYGDKISNLMLGVKELYNIKFNKLFNTFEQLVRDQQFSQERTDVDVAGITRVEVIDENGRQYYKMREDEMSVELSYQDQGRTLKVFVNPK